MVFIKHKKVGGFTLIELLIVVAIIAILAAIAVPNFLEAQIRAKVSRMKNDMRAVATGLEAYRIDYNKYPPWADWRVGDNYTWADYHNNATPLHAKIPNYITTPIGYTTTLGEDIFVKKSPQTFANTRYPIESRVGFRFQYFPYKNLSEVWADPAQRLVYAYRSDHTGGWMFYSFGPDNQTNQLNADPASPYLPGPNGVYTRYDPTNGTVSRGNIIRTASSGEGSIPKHPLITSAQNGQN